MLFTKEYIQELKKATAKILSICESLNSDTKCILELNTLLPQTSENKLLLKAEKIFISDFIFVFSKVKNLSEKLQFGLAYYYDAVRNQHFANENEIESLNKLVLTSTFKTHFNKIVQSNILFELDKSKTYLLNYLN